MKRLQMNNGEVSDADGPVECRECGERFDGADELREHWEGEGCRN